MGSTYPEPGALSLPKGNSTEHLRYERIDIHTPIRTHQAGSSSIRGIASLETFEVNKTVG